MTELGDPTLAVIEPQHGQYLESVREHGQEWVVCRRCGRQWAVYGSDAELVTDGDGYCNDESDDI